MDTATRWDRWLGVLRERGWGPDAVLRVPATDTAIDGAAAFAGLELPAEVRALYRISDGQRSPHDVPEMATNLFPAHEFLPLSRSVRAWENWRDVRETHGEEMDGAVTVRGDDPVRRLDSAAGWWPLAEDGGGNHLMVDTDPAPGGTVGQIVVAGRDATERRVLAPGLDAYLDALCAADLDDPDPDGLADGVAWWDAPALR